MQKPIAFGRKSEIFDIGNDQVLKLYCKGFPGKLIDLEFSNCQLVSEQTDLPIPKPISLQTVNDRKGIVFEKLVGESYLDTFQKKPWLFFTQIKPLVAIHEWIHQFTVKGLPSQQESFSEILKNTDRLSDTEKQTVLGILNKPHTAKLCHGDFHQGNVFLTTDNQAYILDWMGAFSGEPLLDIALTVVGAAVSDAPEHIPSFYRSLYEVFKKVSRIDTKILSNYHNVDAIRMQPYLVLAAAIHLARKEGNEFQDHRKYFKRTYTLLT